MENTMDTEMGETPVVVEMDPEKDYRGPYLSFQIAKERLEALLPDLPDSRLVYSPDDEGFMVESSPMLHTVGDR